MCENIKYFDSYEIGKNNKDGEKIVRILSREKGKYVIYCCSDTDDLFFDGTEEAQKLYSDISIQIAKINTIMYDDKKNNNFFREQITCAIEEALKGNIDGANEIILKLENKAILLRDLECRVYYLLGALIPFIVNMVISTVFIIWHNSITDELWKECVFIYYIITFGSMGGFLSISMNVKKLDIDFNSGILLNFISGFLRMTIAMTGSLFIYFVVKANIIISLANQSNSKYFVFALAVVSGFSETFIPNMIAKIEKQVQSKNKDGQAGINV